MKKLFLFFFLLSCSSPTLNTIDQNKNLIFDEQLTFDEFNNMLTEYVKKGNYPNIDR